MVGTVEDLYGLGGRNLALLMKLAAAPATAKHAPAKPDQVRWTEAQPAPEARND
jgi:hypothetical protein